MSINLIAYEPWVDIGTRTQASHRWGLTATQDLDRVLAQPFRIAIVPAFCSQPDWYLSNTVTHNLDWSLFDLVLIHEMEWISAADIKKWAKSLPIKAYLIGAGSWYAEDDDDPDIVPHLFWMAQMVDDNVWQCTAASGKKYLFDALLGSRRVHRDYVMYQMQSHPDIMRKTFLTYRSHTYRDNPDPFPLHSRFHYMRQGLRDIKRNLVTEQARKTQQILDQPDPQQYLKQRFHDLSLQHPYMTDDAIVNDIGTWVGLEARVVPWNVFQHSYFSLVTETLHDASHIFLTEKTAKPLYAGRLFVIFSAAGSLARLRAMGFETFSNVIDESYDNEPDLFRRWDLCWEQIKYLTRQSPEAIIHNTRSVLEHNSRLMQDITGYIRAQSLQQLRRKIPAQYFSDL